jgi:DNA repair protein RecO (recombination protein O)
LGWQIPTLTSAEIDVSGFNLIENDLQGDQLVCGFYCNELLVYLLHRHDPHPQLFDRYHSTIIRLYDPESVASEAKLAATVRKFEQIMLKETGYEVSFEKEADGKTAIQGEAFYQFQPGQGFVRSLPDQVKSVAGDVILAMQADLESNAAQTHMIRVKHLMRDILKQSLGHQKINSRELFFPKAR